MIKLRNIACIMLLLMIGTAVSAKDAVVLGWQDCVRESIKSNPFLAASVQKIRQSKAETWVATSPFLPQINTSLNANKTDTFSGSGSGGNNNTYSVKGEQLLFDGLKVYNNVRSAEENLKAFEYNYTVDSSETRYSLKKAFSELLRAQKLIPIMEGIIDRRKQNFEMIKLKYESGGEHEGSLLLAEADVAQAEYDLRKAVRDVSVAQYALRKELGWENDTPINVVGEFKVEEASRVTQNFKDIADGHPLVSKAQAEKESAKYSVESAEAEFFPNIKFSTEAGKVGIGGVTTRSEWKVGLAASLPVVDGGLRIANTQKAKAKLLQVKSDEKNKYDTVMSALEKTWQGLQDAIENVDVQGKYLKAAETRAKISRAEYANGLLIFDNWIIIEDNYVKAQVNYVNAQANMLIAEADWVRAKGEGLEYVEHEQKN